MHYLSWQYVYVKIEITTIKYNHCLSVLIY